MANNTRRFVISQRFKGHVFCHLMVGKSYDSYFRIQKGPFDKWEVHFCGAWGWEAGSDQAPLGVFSTAKGALEALCRKYEAEYPSPKKENAPVSRGVP